MRYFHAQTCIFQFEALKSPDQWYLTSGLILNPFRKYVLLLVSSAVMRPVQTHGTYDAQVHIPTLLKMIMDCYDERQYPCCLDVMTTAVEVYGGADEAVEHFRAILGRASARTFTAVHVRVQVSSVVYTKDFDR